MRLNYNQYNELNEIQSKNELNAKKSYWYREIFLKNLSESLCILKAEINSLNNIQNTDTLKTSLSNIQIRRSLLNKTKAVVSSINIINNYIFIDDELSKNITLKFEAIEDVLGCSNNQTDYLSVLSDINRFEVELYNDLYSYEINEYKSKK